AGAAGTETFMITGLTSDGTADIDVTAMFATTTSCTNTNADIYDAPADCSPVCMIAVELATPGPCDPNTNTYDLEVQVTYLDAPAGEMITITTDNGGSQSFTPAGAAGTETFTVTGLASDGTADIDVTAMFATTTSCTGTLPDAYSAPADCSPTCEITVNSAVPSDCDPPTNSYTLAVSVTYSVAPAGEDVVITLNGGASQSFTPSGTDETETFTLTGLTSDGTADIDVTAAFATTTNCSNTNLNAYDAPADCSPLFSIGSTVFEDGNNNGLLDPTEAGIPNVELQIYAVVGNKDDAINGETDDLLQEVGSDGDLSTPTDNLPYLTDPSGNYFFSELAEGTYYVVIPASNFSGSLSELPISSTDIA
ncbi:MAG: SdrD B-like domain-containing protein, partial [Bacteroidota bacterium]